MVNRVRMSEKAAEKPRIARKAQKGGSEHKLTFRGVGSHIVRRLRKEGHSWPFIGFYQTVSPVGNAL